GFNGTMPDGIKAADIVQSHDVIGVRVSEDDGVNAVDLVGDALRAELGGGIDQNMGVAVRDQNRGAGAFVVGIGAGADSAVAADHGNAGTGAGAEEEELDLG